MVIQIQQLIQKLLLDYLPQMPLIGIAKHYNTPEKYQAGLDSGEINGLMTDNGAQIDQQVARRFMDQQVGVGRRVSLAANS
ncbi:MAG: hypothetical protein KAX99_04065 [Azonexus sp.]|nr:hypothetical protein [Azonexus sp.]